MKLFDKMPYLENDKVILREMTIADAPQLQAIAKDPEVYKYLPTFLYEQQYEDPEEVITRMHEECFLTKTSILLGIYQTSAPDIMTGIAEIYGWDEKKNKASIGVRLAKEYWHRGIALPTEILLKEYLVNEIGIRTITAHVLCENEASAKILQEIGFENKYPGLWEDWGRGGPEQTDKYVYRNPRAVGLDIENESTGNILRALLRRSAVLNGVIRLAKVFVRPYSEGKKLVEEKRVGCSVAAMILHVLCSGLFFFHLVSKTDVLLQGLLQWLNDGTGEMLQRLTDIILGFLNDTVITWIGMIPSVGEVLQGLSTEFANEGVHSLADTGEIYINQFYQDLSDAMRLPAWASFGFTCLIVAAIVVVLVLLIWAYLKITKHKWCSFQKAFCLGAIRSIATIPFAIVSTLLIFINPLFGIALFAFAIFWSMTHLYTAIMAGANQTSGNRGAAWFPPIMILMYLLAAAVMIVIIIVVGITLYHQLSDMAQMYMEAISEATSGIAP